MSVCIAGKNIPLIASFCQPRNFSVSVIQTNERKDGQLASLLVALSLWECFGIYQENRKRGFSPKSRREREREREKERKRERERDRKRTYIADN
jgi:hypothetical protein